jgi:hypothetical protein
MRGTSHFSWIFIHEKMNAVFYGENAGSKIMPIRQKYSGGIV